MNSEDCVRFLQDTLPRARLRWPGFRKVRRQVCKRLRRRQRELGLQGFAEYMAYLEREPGEWEVFDSLCRIPISRFYRDRGVFDLLRERVFPELIGRARAGAEKTIHVWSAGSASGEEPYTLAIMWRMAFAATHPGLRLSIRATDADETMLHRARAARYSAGSLKELPELWRRVAFARANGDFVLRPEFAAGVEFQRQDIRHTMPDGPFDLVLCRNLAFTYFDAGVQRDVLDGIRSRLRPGGFLVIGKHERLPEELRGFSAISPGQRIFRADASEECDSHGVSAIRGGAAHHLA